MRRTWLGLALAVLVTVGCDDDTTNPTVDGGAGSGGAKLDGSAGTGGTAGAAAGSDGGVKDGGTADGPTSNVTMALAQLSATSAFGTGDAGASFMGSVVFMQTGTTAKAIVNLVNAPAGMHGIHIHVGGSCADSVDDGGVVAAGMAGGHWNPATMNHGELGGDGGMHHAGDLGNVTVSAVGGTANKSVTTMEWKVADVVGKTVVLHMKEDDLMTNPSGNSGSRIACGVITAK